VKKTNSIRPSRREATILRQICELIPAHVVSREARQLGIDQLARSFSPWSHLVAMLQAQLSHALSLNDVCDSLNNWRTPLRAIRGATPPSRNTLSHANKIRSCELAQRVLYSTIEHLQQQWPAFARGARPQYAWRFKAPIHLVDSSVIELVASCMDWAKHRRRKAAAKCHMRLSLRSLLPQCAVVDTAAEHDSQRASELCAGLQDGEIAVFDKAYLSLDHLWELQERGVQFVTRAKENLDLTVVQKRPRGSDDRVVSDQIVQFRGRVSASRYPGKMRLVRLRVEVEGEEREMAFLTNNQQWQPASVGALYRSRWQIEAFFKQVKQTLQLADFIGHSANAVQWQVWVALLVYVLLRFIHWQNRWAHSFSRLLTMLRSGLWMRRSIADLLRRCGTADGHIGAIDRRCTQSDDLPGLVGQPT
jgi:hypothetical protein